MRAPPLAGHRGGAAMAQGGLHQGVAVSGGFPCFGMLSLNVEADLQSKRSFFHGDFPCVMQD